LHGSSPLRASNGASGAVSPRGPQIRLEKVSKVFPGGARPAVDTLDLEVAGGHTCVLIGPSGCGKTTTMRIVNRLIETSAGPHHRRGRGRDTAPIRSSCAGAASATSSRRSALFPH